MLTEIAIIIGWGAILLAIWVIITIVTFVFDALLDCEFVLVTVVSVISGAVLTIIWLLYIATILLGFK